jgi:glutamate-5-semialdehyde dehydrogenase
VDEVISLCKTAADNAAYIGSMPTDQKNKMLRITADALIAGESKILEANAIDIKTCGKPAHIIDRLALNPGRVKAMADGIAELIKLPDPVGEIIDEWTNKAGLKIRKARVPFGVVGIIYEARPNVTADAVGLCLKSGNSVVLRGGSDALNSNKSIVAVIKDALTAAGYRADFIQFLPGAARADAETLMKCREYVDVLLPRGSAGLIKTVVEKSSVPVIETGTGNCHAYVESTADFDTASKIILNGKLQRPSVCNALESLLVDRKIAAEFLPRIVAELTAAGVEVVGCNETRAIVPAVSPASDGDFAAEFLGLKISVKVVDGVAEAVAHINKYGSSHSEVIITRDNAAAKKFTEGVDSAAVYVNASTRFTDGFEFGFGAEMGISTQKLHARGPIGLREMTSYKYIVFGDGQVRG